MSSVQTTSATRDCRSCLYMPASNQRVLEKGPSLQADVVILDLEDSVGPDQKTTAREQAVNALSQFDYGGIKKAVRINTADTSYYEDDVASISKSLPHAVVLPKVETAEDVLKLSHAIDQFEGAANVEIWAMIETPRAILNAEKIAAGSGDRLKALLIGNNDLAKAANMPVGSDRTYLVPWLMNLVAVASAYSLALFDGVYNDFSDIDGFTAECQQSKAMGMNGKTLIHPSQIAIANSIYMPDAAAIDEAREIVEAFSKEENKDVGVLQINGRMIERLHLTIAQQLLARVARLENKA